jgi:cytoskeletal protein CcmA (bactofilin family)
MRNRILAGLLVCFSLVAFNAKADLYSAGVDLGKAGRTQQWAVFTLGNGVSQNLTMDTSSSITGNVGAAGTGNVTIQDSTSINGDLYQHTGGKFTTKGGAKLKGSRFQNASTDALLNQAAIDAQNASDEAFGLAVTPAYASLTNVNLSGSQNMTITGSGKVVLKLQNFTLTGSSTFTLTGTAGTAFIINVSNQFSLALSSKIVLGTGISAANVLFNIRGTGSVTLSGSSTLNGILLATKRSVTIQNSATVRGEVIANSVAMHDSAKVVTPSTNL